MKCLFIYNPISGKSKKIIKKLNYVEEKLKEKFDTVDIIPTQYAGHTIELAREACGKYDALIFSGGDGTFSEVVKGIGENRNAPTLGFIPSGTVSDMANNYKIPRNIKKALKVCLEGNRTKIDVCKINDSYFAYAGALGTYTDTTFKTTPRMKKKYGRMAYFLQGAKEVFKVREQTLNITVGKKNFTQEAILTLILNTKSVGGFSKFNYQNKLGDGKFDVVIVKKPQLKTPVNVWKLFAMGVNKFIDDDNVMVFSADNISINVNENVDWNLDGDPFSAKKIDVSCLKKRLALFTPKE